MIIDTKNFVVCHRFRLGGINVHHACTLIVAMLTVYGNVVIGPTADDTNDKENTKTADSVISQLIDYGHKILPALKKYSVVGTYAGLRPATGKSDYQISHKEDRLVRYISINHRYFLQV